MRSLLLAGISSGLLLGAVSAQATLVVYTDESSFQAALGGAAMAGEGFEGVTPFIYPSLTFGPMQVHTDTDVIVSNDPLYVTEGAQGILWGPVPHGNISFDFTGPINAFAVDLKGVGDFGPVTIRARVRAFDYDVFVDATGTATDVRFVGLIDSAAGFSSVTLTASPFADSMGVDRVQYGPVPEPATAGLLAMGLALLAAQRRRS